MFEFNEEKEREIDAKYVYTFYEQSCRNLPSVLSLIRNLSKNSTKKVLTKILDPI